VSVSAGERDQRVDVERNSLWRERTREASARVFGARASSTARRRASSIYQTRRRKARQAAFNPLRSHRGSTGDNTRSCHRCRDMSHLISDSVNLLDFGNLVF